MDTSLKTVPIVSFVAKKPLRVICTFNILDSEGNQVSDQTTFFDVPKDDRVTLSFVPNLEF